MAKSTMTSRQFNQDTSGAKKAAQRGPMFITDRGCPKHVLLSIEEYRRLAGVSGSIIEMLASPGAEDVAFDPPRLDGSLTVPVDID
jgi:prevent-host-death family protein